MTSVPPVSVRPALNTWRPSNRLQPKLRSDRVAGFETRSISSHWPWPTSPIQIVPLLRSNENRHGLRRPMPQMRGFVPARLDVEAQHLAEQRVAVLGVAELVAAAAAVAGGEPQPPVGPELQLAAVVVARLAVPDRHAASGGTCPCRRSPGPRRSSRRRCRSRCSRRRTGGSSRTSGGTRSTAGPLAARLHARAHVDERRQLAVLQHPDDAALVDHEDAAVALRRAEEDRLARRRSARRRGGA